MSEEAERGFWRPRRAMNEAREIGAECPNHARNEPKPKARAVAEVWDFVVKSESLSWGIGSFRSDRSHSAAAARPKIDKSAPIFGEPKRIRYQKHLRFVASQPWNPFSRAPHPLGAITSAEPQGKR
jgi:hypothetical protein